MRNTSAESDRPIPRPSGASGREPWRTHSSEQTSKTAGNNSTNTKLSRADGESGDCIAPGRENQVMDNPARGHH